MILWTKIPTPSLIELTRIKGSSPPAPRKHGMWTLEMGIRLPIRGARATDTLSQDRALLSYCKSLSSIECLESYVPENHCSLRRPQNDHVDTAIPRYPYKDASVDRHVKNQGEISTRYWRLDSTVNMSISADTTFYSWKWSRRRICKSLCETWVRPRYHPCVFYTRC